jgi:hypothetical protein
MLVSEFWVRGLIAFTCSAVADVFWTKYIAYAAMKRKAWLKASLWGAMILVPGTVGMLNLIEDRRMFFFSFLGAFVGTAVTLRLGPE